MLRWQNEGKKDYLFICEENLLSWKTTFFVQKLTKKPKFLQVAMLRNKTNIFLLKNTVFGFLTYPLRFRVLLAASTSQNLVFPCFWKILINNWTKMRQNNTSHVLVFQWILIPNNNLFVCCIRPKPDGQIKKKQAGEYYDQMAK